jgi:tRNA 2-selenouridine synthase
VEAESNKIGRIALPTSLVTAMHTGDCVLLETALEARVQLLMEDYQHFLTQPELLMSKLQSLLPFHGHQQLECWRDLVIAGQFKELVAELLALHYDPSYLRALGKHFSNLSRAEQISLTDLSETSLKLIAQQLSLSVQLH